MQRKHKQWAPTGSSIDGHVEITKNRSIELEFMKYLHTFMDPSCHGDSGFKSGIER